MNKSRCAFALAVAAFSSARPLDAASVRGDRLGMRNARYCELFVVKRGRAGPSAQVYNTLGLNTCPDAQWLRLDTSELKKTLRAFAVVKNGPRYFLMDSSSYDVPGEGATFDRLDMRLVAQIVLPFGSLLPWHKRQPYTETKIKRTTRWTYDAGKPVYELTGPHDETYVMQSYALIVDPHQTQASLAVLAARLKLPPGWTYRTFVPHTNVVVSTVDGTAHIIQDDLENTYQRLY